MDQLPGDAAASSSGSRAIGGSTASSVRERRPVSSDGESGQNALATAASSAAAASSGLTGLEAALATGGDSDDVRATLGNVATGLAEQLSSITQEMNKIRQELYGDSGIGGIAKELEMLKSGGLGGLLDDGALDGMLGKASAASASGNGGSKDVSKGERLSAVDRLVEARERRGTGDRDRDLDELKRKLLERRNGQTSEQGITFREKFVLFALLLICIYLGSPFFRTTVKQTISSLFFGQVFEEDPEFEDLGY
eukprot:TRINITY_DN45898_c0_g1_i1.p2 TRINITY_DN45898_c0_g1~~TRINITY_DN45898_c0_g1_i1.p2  ORF type:complete len:253 (-),score=65.73 TRINITY_DN45898_c0_g1_i1:73-831(-)